MFKEGYHPKAFLIHKRNVKRGLSVRSKIIATLEEGPLDTKRLAEKIGVSSSSVLHHLRLLKIEKIVTRQSKARLWKLTGIGQQRLTDIALHMRNRSKEKWF